MNAYGKTFAVAGYFDNECPFLISVKHLRLSTKLRKLPPRMFGHIAIVVKRTET